MSGVIESGALLAGAKPGAFDSSYVGSPAEHSEALFQGNFDEFMKQHESDELMIQQLRNIVKLCSCGKPCAFTLSTCNACGSELPSETTFSDNIFMGFIYGVRAGNFPYVVSIRHQSEDILIFDDILALTPCHFNCIPTNWYIPDWRFLLRNPTVGLRLLQNLEETAWNCIEEQFLSHSGFRSKILKDSESFSNEKMKKCVIAGLNFPPSQFQFHVQYMLLPLLPFQYSMYLAGAHFTEGRFFPVEYVKAVLQLDIKMDVNMDTPVEDIMQHFEGLGVSYKDMHAECFQRAKEMQLEIGNWSPEDFSGTILGDEVVGIDSDKKSLVAADKNTLQNYGRPYTESGKSAGTYYKFAKEARIPHLDA